ncbi:hypothetical protein SF148580_3286 [Shigella flexneri 1485-80]|nr:hypothetical protein SF148580_3286 [Shigella flexneri 1485-80]
MLLSANQAAQPWLKACSSGSSDPIKSPDQSDSLKQVMLPTY